MEKRYPDEMAEHPCHTGAGGPPVKKGALEHMAFFDEFSQKAKTFANVATEKTKEVVDSAKLTASILAEQRELDKSYRAVGEWFVSTCEEEIPEAVADIVAAAKASKERIAELQELRRLLEEGEL